MEERSRRRLAFIMTSLVGLVYFLAFATPLHKELVVEPRWVSALDGLPASPPADSQGALQPYRLGSHFGYFDPEKGALFAAPLPYGLALSESAFVAYDRLPTSLSFRSPQGKELFATAEPGYPFISAGRRFLLRPGQSSVAELDAAGATIWSRDFPALITAFAASPGLALFGLMDGSLVGLDSAGRQTLAFSPGGSRLAGIFGCAVSPDGLLAAAISGIDKQRLVILEKRKSDYRVTHHRWLESDFRRPVAMAFTEDGQRLLYEAPGGVGIYDRASREEALLSAREPSALGLSFPDRDILLALEGGSEEAILFSSLGGRRIYSLGFQAGEASLAQAGGALYLGVKGEGGEALLRLDIREE